MTSACLFVCPSLRLGHRGALHEASVLWELSYLSGRINKPVFVFSKQSPLPSPTPIYNQAVALKHSRLPESYRLRILNERTPSLIKKGNISCNRPPFVSRSNQLPLQHAYIQIEILMEKEMIDITRKTAEN